MIDAAACACQAAVAEALAELDFQPAWSGGGENLLQWSDADTPLGPTPVRAMSVTGFSQDRSRCSRLRIGHCRTMRRLCHREAGRQFLLLMLAKKEGVKSRASHFNLRALAEPRIQSVSSDGG